MLLKCVNANGVVGLTKGAFYKGLDDDGKYVRLENDLGETVQYKLRHFKVLVKE